MAPVPPPESGRSIEEAPIASSSSRAAAEAAADVDVSSQLPIRFISKVIPGFGRGSKELGIPTANLSKADTICTMSVESLPTGIYWGYARIGEAMAGNGNDNGNGGGLGHTYTTAVSIGYNPTYGNSEKTIEPHLIAPQNHPRRHSSSCGETLFQDFYGETIRLSVVGYLRPELPFEGLEKLTIAIKNDIVNAVKLGNVSSSNRSSSSSGDDVAVSEKNWVEGKDESVQIM